MALGRWAPALLLGCALGGAEQPGGCVRGGGESCAAPQADCPDGAPRSRALVTGITGMIGSFVARELVKEPCTMVYGLVRWRSSLLNLQGTLDRITLVYGDLSDAFRIRDVVRQVMPDRIFHFGGQAINNVGFDSPQYTLQVNVLGTLNLLEAVREVEELRKSSRILLAGSSTEYGQTGDLWDGAPIPETAPLVPVSPYGVSKVSAEMLARQYFLAYGVQTVIARIFIHVAPGGTQHLAIQEFSRQVAMIEQGLQEPRLWHGNLRCHRDMTDVRDAAPVYLALLEKGVPGEAYNVGSNITYSTQEILELILQQARVQITAAEDPSRFRRYDEKVLLADISKLVRLLGWVPKPDMRRTAADVLDFWRREVSLRYGTGAAHAAQP